METRRRTPTDRNEVRLQNLEAANHSIRCQLKETQDFASAREGEIRTLRAQLQDLTRAAAAGESETHAQSTALQQALWKLQEQEASLRVREEENQRLRTLLDEVQAELISSKSRASEFAQQHSGALSRLAIQEAELQKLKAVAVLSAKEFQDREQQFQTNADGWVAEKQMWEQQLQRERQLVAGKFDESLAKCTREKQRLEAAKCDLEATLQASRGEVESLLRQLEDSQRRLAGKQREEANWRASSEAKCSSLRQQLEDQATELSAAQERACAFEVSLQECQQLVSSQKEHAARLAGSLEDMKQNLQAEEQARGRVELERDQLREAAMDDQKAAESKRKQLELAQCELSEELQTQASLLKSKEADCRSLQLAIARNAEAHRQETHALEVQLQEALRSCERVREEMLTLKEQHATEEANRQKKHSTEQAAAHQQAEATLQEVQRLSEQCAGLYVDLRAAKREVEVAQAEKTRIHFAAAKCEQDLRSEVRRLERDCQRMSEELHAIRAALQAQCADEVERRHQEVEAARQDVRTLTEQLSASRLEAASLSFQLQAKAKEVVDAQLEAERHSRELQREAARVSASATAREKELAARICTLESQLSASQDTVAIRERELFCAEAELRTATAEKDFSRNMDAAPTAESEAAAVTPKRSSAQWKLKRPLARPRGRAEGDAVQALKRSRIHSPPG